MEARIKEVAAHIVTKVDCELFDEEVNNIKTAINALSTTTSQDTSRPMP